MTTALTRPFEAIPPDAAAVLRPVLPGLADETIAAIAREVPDYERAMEGEFGQIVRLGVEVAFNRFVDLIADPAADAGEARETYVNLGRGEYHSGRSLDALLAAYRVGARLAWRRFVDIGVAADLPPEAIYALGEAIFAYIDELSGLSAAGYAEEQSASAGETERRRRRLVRLLVQHPPPAQEAIRTAAAAAGWVLPRQVAALVAATVERPAEPGAGAIAEGAAIPGEEIVDTIAARLARKLANGAIGAAAGGAATVIVPDPDAPGRRRQIEATITEGPVALGPTTGWATVARSAQRAAAAHRLAVAGRIRPKRGGSGARAAERGGLVVADEHLAQLLLAADPSLAGELAQTRLAPLAELPKVQRRRLEATLRAWLDRPGQVQAVAAELKVHPQTVRYRLRKLRDLFGPSLDDPEGRFELQLALRSVPA
jgi:PucR C-terminal helix-turn-helix domain